MRDQCAAAGVPFWLKNLGPGKGRFLDGQEHDGRPLYTMTERIKCPKCTGEHWAEIDYYVDQYGDHRLMIVSADDYQYALEFTRNYQADRQDVLAGLICLICGQIVQ